MSYASLLCFLLVHFILQIHLVMYVYIHVNSYIILYNLNGGRLILLEGNVSHKAAPEKYQELEEIAKRPHCITYK